MTCSLSYAAAAAVIFITAGFVPKSHGQASSYTQQVNALIPVSAKLARTRGQEEVCIKTRGAQLIDEANKEAEQPSVSLSMNFAYNSTKLEPDSLLTLSVLGRVLKDAKLSCYEFRIVGHTDSVGSEQYNQDLSERRANAVRDHLVTAYRIERTRLNAMGFGKAHLLDKNNPESSVNRRVEIRNIADVK